MREGGRVTLCLSMEGIQMWRMDGEGEGRRETIVLLKIWAAGLEGETNPSVKEEEASLCRLQGRPSRGGSGPHVKTMNPESARPPAHQ